MTDPAPTNPAPTKTVPHAASAADPDQGKAVSERDRAHVFHSWSAQDQISPLPVAGAAGSRFWDYEGNSYLDFASQLVFTNIGHQHPRVSPRSRSRRRGCARSPRPSPTTSGPRPPS